MQSKYDVVINFIKNIDFQPKLLKTIRNYNRRLFVSDFIAGIIVGIVALPLAIAFAISSGVKPEQGIITAIIAGFIISFFGGSKVQIGGPTGAFIVIVYGIVAEYSMVGLIIATILAGIILIIMGVFKLGTIIKYIPFPIIVGFTSGIAVTIFSTQIGDLFGMSFEGEKIPADFLGKWYFYLIHIGSTKLLVLLIGILSILIIIYTPIYSKKAYNFAQSKWEQTSVKYWKWLKSTAAVFKVIPGSLMAILLITVLGVILTSLGAEGIDTIGDRFTISATVPEAEMPSITWAHIKELFPIAITIALLGAIESLLSATVADGVINDKHNSNTELIAQGIANIITPIFGGIPATGAIARTMTNINNGGRTPIAGIIHAAVLLLILLVVMPLAQYIPMVCLAGVLIIVAYNMSEWRTFKNMLNNPKSDIAVLLTTFLLTVIFDLTIAIQIGIVIACLFFMKRVAETTKISQITGDDEDVVFDGETSLVVPIGIDVYEINGPYFFGIANKFEEQISIMNIDTYVRIIRMRKVPFIDSTGINNLSNLCKKSLGKGVPIVLSGVQPEVKEALVKMRLNDLIGDDNICPHIDAALKRAEYLMDEIKTNEAKNKDPFEEEKLEVNS